MDRAGRAFLRYKVLWDRAVDSPEPERVHCKLKTNNRHIGIADDLFDSIGDVQAQHSPRMDNFFLFNECSCPLMLSLPLHIPLPIH